MREIKIGQVYQHFKGNYYVVLDVVNDCDNAPGEFSKKMVVYQALYGDHLKWARRLDEFMSEVDHIKYPAATQKYRFEEINLGEKSC